MILPASKHPKKMMQSKEDQLIELKEIFWNNIKVGQWDFASGVLQNVKIISEKEYENLLVECILHPTTYCDGSLSLPSPIHLSYLAAQELIEYHGGDKRKISSIRPEVFLKIEFNLILHRLGDRAPLNLIKELSMYHQDLVLHDLGIVTQSTVNPLSPELCECISKLILTDPLLASILVKLMSGKTGVHQTNNLELQQLFCKQVSSLLSQLLQEADGNSFRETFDNLTSILAISQSYLSSDDELFVETCKHFYRKLLAMENQNYAQEFVISFLGETGDTSLLKMLQEYETDIRLESLNIGYSHTSYSLVETGKYIASKLEGGSAEQWMNMFLLCYKHKLHLLQCIVDACCLLVDEKRYEELTDILTFVKPLVPLILFLSWEKLPNFEDARMLLECLQNIMPNREFDGVLGNVCQQLEYQTNLIEWCLQKTREILGDEYDGDTIVDKLFQQIDSKSVLSVLSGAHLLKTLNYEEVMNLLEKKHHFDKSTKTSQFSEEDDFICYCVIKRYYHLILGENSGLITEDDGIQVPFSNELIKTYMLEIKQEISKLTSPLLKIEILENLFAMIFLRSTDLKHFRFTEDIDNDNLDAASISSSFTFGSVSPSIDSLSTIGEDQAEFKFSSSFKTNQERFMLENISKESKPSPVSTNTVLLQEIGESSSETLKATSGPCDEKLDEILSSSPRFLVSADILRETLYLIDECILQVKTFESLDDSVSNGKDALPEVYLEPSRTSIIKLFLRK